MIPVLRRSGRFLLVVFLAFAGVVFPGAAGAQDQPAATALFTALSQHFEVPSGVVISLSDWRLAPDDIPVVLFIAGHGGISPEAVVALRRSGHDWTAIAHRYRLDAASFHVPLSGNAGSL